MPGKLWCDHTEGFDSSLESLGRWTTKNGNVLQEQLLQMQLSTQ